MTPSNGSKVGIREFLTELRRIDEARVISEKKQDEKREEMERRIVDAINAAVQGIDGKYSERLKCAEVEIVNLRIADRKWGGVTALAAAFFTAIGTSVGIYLKK